MNLNQYNKARILVGSFVAAMFAIAATSDNILLAFCTVVIGMIFMVIVRKKTNIRLADERTEKISGHAARITYAILTVFLSVLSVFLILSGNKTGDIYAESLGTILSYIVLLSLGLYAMSYKYFNKYYGAEDEQ